MKSVLFRCLLLVGAACVAQAGSLQWETPIVACWNTEYSGPITTDTAACDNSTRGFSETLSLYGGGVTFGSPEPPQIGFAVAANSFWIEYQPGDWNDTSDLFIFDLIGAPAFTEVTLAPGETNLLGVQAAFDGSRLALLVTNPDCCTESVVRTTFRFTLVSAVPEPSTVLLMGVGIVALLVLPRRRLFPPIPKDADGDPV